MSGDSEDLPDFDADSNGLVSWAESEETPLPTSSAAPLIPELPEFIDHLIVNDINTEIERLLALRLDAVNTSGQVKSWQFLAERLGMTWEEINYLQARAKYPVSPTSEILWRFRNENLGKVLRIIRDEMRRIDVIIKLLPHLSELEEGRVNPNGICNGAAAAIVSKGNSQSRGDDSGVDSQFNSAAQTAPSGRTKVDQTDRLSGSIVELRVSATRDLLEQMGSASSTRLLSNNFALPDTSIKPRGPLKMEPSQKASVFAIDPKSGPTVLVTYMDDDTPHLKKVRWLCKNLRENLQCPAQVFTDDTQESQMVSDTIGYLDEVFKRAENIVVVISKAYKCAVETDGTVAGYVDVHSRNCCYLYKLMAAEYRDLGAINRRFRPVIFHEKDYEFVPLFLKNTLTFLWPKQHDQLMTLMFDSKSDPVDAAEDKRNGLVVKNRSLADQSG